MLVLMVGRYERESVVGPSRAGGPPATLDRDVSKSGNEDIRNADLYDLVHFDHIRLKRDLFRRFGRIDEVRNLLNVGKHLGIHALCWTVIVVLDHPLMSLCVSVVMALNLVGIFILQHDAGHGSRSRSKFLNTVIGDLSGGLFGFGFPWVLAREQHRAHHRHNAELDDPTAVWMPLTVDEYRQRSGLARLAYRLKMNHVLFSWIEYWTFRSILPRVVPEHDWARRRLRREALRAGTIGISMNLASIALADSLMGFPGIVYLYLLPNFIGINLGTMIEKLAHSHPEMRFYAPVHGSSGSDEARDMQGTICIRYPAIIEFLINNMNEATIHHYVPSIPCYRQRAARAYVARHHPGLFNERRFSFAYLMRVYRGCHLLESRANPVYVSFEHASAIPTTTSGATAA